MSWHNLTLDLLNFSEREMPYVIGIEGDSRFDCTMAFGWKLILIVGFWKLWGINTAMILPDPLVHGRGLGPVPSCTRPVKIIIRVTISTGLVYWMYET